MVEDIKMNTFQEVEDCEYIYIELMDGSQGKIKKSVLANLIKAKLKNHFYRIIQKLLKIAIVLVLMRIMVYIG